MGGRGFVLMVLNRWFLLTHGGSIVLLMVLLITWCHASLNTTESIICHLRKGRINICVKTSNQQECIPVGCQPPTCQPYVLHNEQI